jgi:hypothetical protein
MIVEVTLILSPLLSLIHFSVQINPLLKGMNIIKPDDRLNRNEDECYGKMLLVAIIQNTIRGMAVSLSIEKLILTRRNCGVNGFAIYL